MECLDIEVPETFGAGVAGFTIPWAEWWPVLVAIAKEAAVDFLVENLPAMIAWVEERKWPRFIKRQIIRVLQELANDPGIFAQMQ